VHHNHDGLVETLSYVIVLRWEAVVLCDATLMEELATASQELLASLVCDQRATLGGMGQCCQVGFDQSADIQDVMMEWMQSSSSGGQCSRLWPQNHALGINEGVCSKFVVVGVSTA
jgi:hypothetical protein